MEVVFEGLPEVQFSILLLGWLFIDSCYLWDAERQGRDVAVRRHRSERRRLARGTTALSLLLRNPQTGDIVNPRLTNLHLIKTSIYSCQIREIRLDQGRPMRWCELGDTLWTCVCVEIIPSRSCFFLLFLFVFYKARAFIVLLDPELTDTSEFLLPSLLLKDHLRGKGQELNLLLWNLHAQPLVSYASIWWLIVWYLVP